MFAWSDSLDLADELAASTGDEAAERSAISRVYHAAFGTARDHLHQEGQQLPSSAQAHAAVWNRFHATPAPIHRRTADHGRRLRRRRNKADYDNTYPDISRDARLAVDLARCIISDLDQLASSLHVTNLLEAERHAHDHL